MLELTKQDIIEGSNELEQYLHSVIREFKGTTIEETKEVETTENGDQVIYKKRMTKQYLGGFYVNQRLAQRLREARRWGSSDYEKDTYIEYTGNRYDFVSLGKYRFSITRDYADNLIGRYI